MNRSDKLFAIFTAFHLFMIYCGAYEKSPFPNGKIKNWETLYGGLTGSNTGYDFFSPNVGDGRRLIFELVGPQGQKSLRTLESRIFNEADMKVPAMIYQIFEGEEESSEKAKRKLRLSVAASWAGKMLARFPDSKEITVKVQSYLMPSMKEWQNGMRPYWQDIYSASFTRGHRHKG